MNETTRAEKLADECENFGDVNIQLNLSTISRELRRLSPMEAERDKLLKVNKVLVDALKLISEAEQSKFAVAYCTNMAETALKLAGELE